MSYFITGTGTGVGKTRFASLLVKAIRDRGVDAVGMKPISTGDNTDADQLITASQSSEPRELLNPVHLATAASPFTASVIEGRIIDTDHILNCYRGLVERHDSVIVEGAGGWMVPIRPDFFVAVRPGVGLIPRTQEGLEPLAAVYPIAAKDAFESAAANRQWKLQDIATSLIESGLCSTWDVPTGSLAAFRNLNSPGD